MEMAHRARDPSGFNVLDSTRELTVCSGVPKTSPGLLRLTDPVYCDPTIFPMRHVEIAWKPYTTIIGHLPLGSDLIVASLKMEATKDQRKSQKY